MTILSVLFILGMVLYVGGMIMSIKTLSEGWVICMWVGVVISAVTSIPL